MSFSSSTIMPQCGTPTGCMHVFAALLSCICNSRSHSLACCMLCSFINCGSCSIRRGSYTATMTGGVFALVGMSTQLTHCTITRNGSIMRRSYPAIFVLNPLSFITFIKFEHKSVCAKLELIRTEDKFLRKTCYSSLCLPA